MTFGFGKQNIAKRPEIRLKISRAILVKLYWKKYKTIYEIAKKMGVSHSTIRKRMEKFNIKRRTHKELNKGKNNPMYNKKQSEKCKKINKKRLLGKKGRKSIAYGVKHPYLTALNKSRVGIPSTDDMKNQQSKSMLKYWNSSKGKKQKKKLSEINKKWA